MLIVWTALFWGLLSVGGSICIAQAAPMFRRGPFGAAFGCGAQFLLPIAHRFCACAGALSSVFLRLCEVHTVSVPVPIVYCLDHAVLVPLFGGVPELSERRGFWGLFWIGGSTCIV